MENLNEVDIEDLLPIPEDLANYSPSESVDFSVFSTISPSSYAISFPSNASSMMEGSQQNSLLTPNEVRYIARRRTQQQRIPLRDITLELGNENVSGVTMLRRRLFINTSTPLYDGESNRENLPTRASPLSPSTTISYREETPRRHGGRSRLRSNVNSRANLYPFPRVIRAGPRNISRDSLAFSRLSSSSSLDVSSPRLFSPLDIPQELNTPDLSLFNDLIEEDDIDFGSFLSRENITNFQDGLFF